MESISKYFADSLRFQLNERIKQIALFGSRARGDFKEGSDYDFLIVIDKKDQQIVRTIRNIEVDILDNFDVLSASLIYDESEWERKKRFPIGINILREAIWL